MGVPISINRFISALLKIFRLRANFLNVKYENVKSVFKKMCMCHYLGTISELPVSFSIRQFFVAVLTLLTLLTLS